MGGGRCADDEGLSWSTGGVNVYETCIFTKNICDHVPYFIAEGETTRSVRLAPASSAQVGR